MDNSISVVGVKSVVDFADHRKSDELHEFGARASATFLVEAIESLLGK